MTMRHPLGALSLAVVLSASVTMVPEVSVALLESSDFSSLNPGYYVTFTWVYDTENEAENALPRARTSGFPTAYVREVSD